MHTGALRFLYDKTTDTRYTWRVRLDDQLPSDWHYTVSVEDSQYQGPLLAASVSTGSHVSICKALNVDVVKFASDVLNAAKAYLADFEIDLNLQANYDQAHPGVIIQEFKS